MSTKDELQRIEMLQGTLDLLILRTLLLGPAHGHAIAKAIEFRSDEVLQVEQGSLYPALHRLIKRKWISAADGTSGVASTSYEIDGGTAKTYAGSPIVIPAGPISME